MNARYANNRIIATYLYSLRTDVCNVTYNTNVVGKRSMYFLGTFQLNDVWKAILTHLGMFTAVF